MLYNTDNVFSKNVLVGNWYEDQRDYGYKSKSRLKSNRSTIYQTTYTQSFGERPIHTKPKGKMDFDKKVKAYPGQQVLHATDYTSTTKANYVDRSKMNIKLPNFGQNSKKHEEYRNRWTRCSSKSGNTMVSESHRNHIDFNKKK